MMLVAPTGDVSGADSLDRNTLRTIAESDPDEGIA
jgi:hypothetical protein